jgi:acyl carrier protein
VTTSGPQPQPATLDGIERVVRDLLGDDAVTLTADMRPADVEGWDSLANVSIIFGIEEDFGVALGDDALAGFETVGDLALVVERAQGVRAAA